MMRSCCFILLVACIFSLASCKCDGDIILPDLVADIEAAGVVRVNQPFQIKVYMINQKGREQCEFDVHQPVTSETLTAVTVDYRPTGTTGWAPYEFGTTAGRTQRLLLDTPPPVDCPGDEHESVVSAAITLYDAGEYRFEVTADYGDDVEERDELNNALQKSLN